MSSQQQMGSHSLQRKVFAAVVALAMALATPLAFAEDPSKGVIWYRSPMPLGADGFELNHSKQVFYIMGSAENAELDGAKITRAHLGGEVVAADGEHLQFYPTVLNFRISASALDPSMLTTDIQSIDDQADLNSFLLGLRFRLKAFRALEMQVLDPVAVRQIGMPADVPYNERVYRIAFDTGDIPVDARLVLEVFSAKGELLSKFHFELL